MEASLDEEEISRARGQGGAAGVEAELWRIGAGELREIGKSLEELG